AEVVTKYGFAAGEKLDSRQLAELVMKDEEAFVKVVCFGLGLPKVTFDALVRPDPWAQDVVLGEFFGASIIDPDVLEQAGMEGKTFNAKTRKDANYGRFDAELAVDLADFPLDNMFMSEGQGLVDVSEVQPINFDLKVWRGDTDIANLGLYDDRDPRTVSPSGVFNKGKLIVLT